MYVSAASIWELLLKVRKGKLRVGDNPVNEFKAFCAQLRANVIPVLAEHAYGAVRLGGLHKDPFDRMLGAQAQAEGLALMTSDSRLAEYNIETIW